MTSKSSFLANLRENNKRRLWVWVISALVFVLAFPILISIMISQIKTGSAYLKESFSAEVAEEILHERLLDAMRGQLGFSIKDIQKIIDSPKEVQKAALEEQVEKLKEKKVELDVLIEKAYRLIENL